MIFIKKKTDLGDGKLMQLITYGDQDAFRELYYRYKDRIYYYFYRMLGNSADLANDFLQELFMKIIEKPGSYNPDFTFKTWIFSVANNMCKNEYRSRNVLNEYREHESFRENIDYMKEPAIEFGEVIVKIFQTLDMLGEEHRSSFLLRYREGFSISEIAGILQLPEGTVKSRLHSARKILAEKLNYLKDEIEF